MNKYLYSTTTFYENAKRPGTSFRERIVDQIRLNVD